MVMIKGNHTVEDLIRASRIDEVDAPKGYSWRALDRIEEESEGLDSISELNDQHPERMKDGSEIVLSMEEYLEELPDYASWQPENIDSYRAERTVNYDLILSVGPDHESFRKVLKDEGYRPFCDSQWERLTLNLLSIADSEAADRKAWENASQELSGHKWEIKGVVDRWVYEDIIDDPSDY
ncbi:MAG: hypothetical protein H8Z69_05875 [Nanohaloarchaea archaeon]|nr:hypothetical protein [Candidatus Nanohaloarchaea archaeon]